MMEVLSKLYNDLIWDYRQAVGTGAYIILWLFGLLYCMLGKNSRQDRMRFVLPITVICLVISCPITAFVLMKILDVSTYSRFAWCLLVVPVIAYAATDFIGRISEIVWRRVTATVMIVMIMVSGSWMYTSERFVVAENRYKLSNQTIEVSNYLINNCSEEVIAADESLVCEIRQYTSAVKLYQGRYQGGPGRGLNTHYLNDTPKQFAEYVNDMVRDGCRVIVLSAALDGTMEFELEKEGFVLLDTVGGYNIYHISDE